MPCLHGVGSWHNNRELNPWSWQWVLRLGGKVSVKNSLWAIRIDIECSTWCLTLLCGSSRFISYDRQSAGLRLYLYTFQHRRGILHKTWPISMDGMVNVLSEDALSSKWPVGPEAKSHTGEPEMSTLWWILQSLDFLNKGNLLFAKGI